MCSSKTFENLFASPSAPDIQAPPAPSVTVKPDTDKVQRESVEKGKTNIRERQKKLITAKGHRASVLGGAVTETADIRRQTLLG